VTVDYVHENRVRQEDAITSDEWRSWICRGWNVLFKDWLDL